MTESVQRPAPKSWATEVEELQQERDLLWDAIDKITAYRGDSTHRARRLSLLTRSRRLPIYGRRVMSEPVPRPERNEDVLLAHLDSDSLGGGHPIMVVVPRDALLFALSDLEELREYQEQEEALRRV